MEKIYIQNRNDELVKFSTGKRILRWGFFEETVDGQVMHYQYQHVFYAYKTNKEIIEFLTDFINNLTDQKILNGYVWNDINVYLSTENQFNFKAAYDVAIQTDGSILPITFKLGEDEEGAPIYYTFEDMNTFSNFYIGAISYIQRVLSEGWQEKDLARETFKEE